MGDKIERIKTGIAGLDDMLYGGLPFKSQVIVAGGPGAGKTLLSFEYLYRNAKAGIPSTFIALEESSEAIIKNAKEVFTDFTDIDALIESNMLTIDGREPSIKLREQSDSDAYSFGNMVSDIENVITDNKSKCIAVDSISLLRLMMGNDVSYRRSLLALTSNLRRLNVTSLLTVEIPSSDRDKLRFEPEFFIFDGILVLYQNSEVDKRTLTAEIVKMRGSNHSNMLAPYEITNSGFKIYTLTQDGEMQ